MNVDLILRRCGLCPTQGQVGVCRKVSDKAKELLRRAKNIQAPSTGVKGGMEIAKPAVCVVLASEMLAVEDLIDVKKAQLFSGCTDKTFDACVHMMRTALNVRRKVCLHRMCLRFGCTHLERNVQRLLEEYRNQFVLQLHESRRGHCNFSSPSFYVAAFLLIARKNKAKVDRTQILLAYNVGAQECARVMQNMQDLCPMVACLKQQQDKNQATKKKRKRSSNDMNEEVQDGVALNAEDVIEAYRQNELYEEWKKKAYESGRKHTKTTKTSSHQQEKNKQMKLTQTKLFIPNRKTSTL